MSENGGRTDRGDARVQAAAPAPTRRVATGFTSPTQNVSEQSPCTPQRDRHVQLTMSPERSGRESGMPWQTTSLTDVQMDFGSRDSSACSDTGAASALRVGSGVQIVRRHPRREQARHVSQHIGCAPPVRLSASISAGVRTSRTRRARARHRARSRAGHAARRGTAAGSWAPGAAPMERMRGQQESAPGRAARTARDSSGAPHRCRTSRGAPPSLPWHLHANATPDGRSAPKRSGCPARLSGNDGAAWYELSRATGSPCCSSRSSPQHARDHLVAGRVHVSRARRAEGVTKRTLRRCPTCPRSRALRDRRRHLRCERNKLGDASRAHAGEGRDGRPGRPVRRRLPVRERSLHIASVRKYPPTLAATGRPPRSRSRAHRSLPAGQGTAPRRSRTPPRNQHLTFEIATEIGCRATRASPSRTPSLNEAGTPRPYDDRGAL